MSISTNKTLLRRENTMMPTKAQEKEALNKIKKILDTLGGDPNNSYVLRAFDGCVEHAEENIECDFANSWKLTAENAVMQRDEMKRDIQGMEKAMKEKDARLKSLEEEMHGKSIKIGELGEAFKTASMENTQKDNRIKDLEQQILVLKAKLYDYMTA